MIGSGSFPIFNNAFSFNVFQGKTIVHENVTLLPVTRFNFAYIPEGGVAIWDKSASNAGQVLAMWEGGCIFAL